MGMRGATHQSLTDHKRGFTIVELLIVIVVIGVLAAITVTAYSGAQERARTAQLKNDLSQAVKQLKVVKATTGNYPGGAGSLPKSDDTAYQLRTDEQANEFCLSATASGAAQHYSSAGGLQPWACPGHYQGEQAPAGTNLIAPFSEWTLSGGATYDPATKEITLPAIGSRAESPRVRVDGPSRWRFETAINSPLKPATTEGEYLFGISYYDIEGSPYTVTGGWTSNGRAGVVSPVGTWTTGYWQGSPSNSGPGLYELVMRLSVSDTYGVPGAKYREPVLTIER